MSEVKQKKRLSTKQKNELLKKEGKQLRHFGVKLELQPTDQQKLQIQQTIGCARLIYNTYLDDRNKHYETFKKTLSVSEFKKHYLTPLKNEKTFLKAVDKFALEVACESVEDAFKRFFNKQNRFPKFKSKKKAKKSYTTKFTKANKDDLHGNIEILEGGTIKLPKLGEVAFNVPRSKKENHRVNRLLNGEVKILKVTITEKAGRYFASVACEEVIKRVEPILIECENQVLGLDLGLTHFLTASNGIDSFKIENPRYFRKSEKKLAKLQKRLSKKQLDSANYLKAKQKVAKCHLKIQNQRENFLHQLSRQLVNQSQAIIVEDLNIRGMVKNKHLSKSISDAGWSKFLTYLKYKCEWEGKHYLEIDRWFASSKLCSHCEEKKLMLALNERQWVCSTCGTTHDRDENAAINIQKEGLRLLSQM